MVAQYYLPWWGDCVRLVIGITAIYYVIFGTCDDDVGNVLIEPGNTFLKQYDNKMLSYGVMENNVMRYLPYYLVHRCIIPYTYELQPKQLRMDIRSFRVDYSLVENIYYTMYNSSILFTDLVQYCNGAGEDIDELSPKYIKILRRHIALKNKTDEFIQSLELHNRFGVGPRTHARRSRIIWGLLTPSERNEFINTYILEDDAFLEN